MGTAARQQKAGSNESYTLRPSEFDKNHLSLTESQSQSPKVHILETGWH